MDDFVPVTDKRLDIGLFSNEKSHKKRSKLKKKKSIENYKNIKLLKSIYDEEGEGEGEGEDDVENVENVETTDNTDDKDDKDVENVETEAKDNEGFELLNQFVPAGMDGGGKFNAESIKEVFDIRYYTIEAIDKLHSFIIDSEYNFSYIVTKTLSLGDFIEDDVNIIKKYITWFFTICISSYVIYNWFFISFYRNVIDQKDVNITSQINRQKLKELSTTNPFLFLTEPYLKFSVFFPEMLYSIFAEKIPEVTENNFIPAFSFVLLFYAIIYMFYNFAETFRKFVEDTLLFNVNNIYIIMIIVITIILFLVEWVESLNINFNSVGRLPVKLISKAASKTPFVQIIYYILYAIYFGIVIMITPFLGSVLSIFFILFASFCSMGLSVRENIQKIHYYINESLLEIKKDTFTQPITMFQKIKNFINQLFIFIYKYVFHSALLFMILWSFNDYINNVKSDPLKTSLLIINSLIIFIFGAIVYIHSINGNPTKNQTYDEKHQSQ